MKERAEALNVAVVRTVDDLMQVFAVRAQVYVAEQDCPYVEEFDGNDLAGATHLLVRAGAEPVATMRIRWFANFAKFERICVRAKHRGAQAAERLVEFGCRLAARKGYAKVLVHADQRLVGHWERVAQMRARAGRPAFSYSQIVFVEMERALAPDAQALTIDSSPLVLVRPEGDWDRPGVLDASATPRRRAGNR
ncbi:MAG: GNAT family N-acetyltransferase [Vitreimonas sp.]